MAERDDPDAGAREALRLLGADPPNWVPARPGIDHDVAIVGGGQTGCALAWALRRAGAGRVAVLDAAADKRGAGIWLNAARMNLLRTPKGLPGPELGVPALGFQAWYEARHGREAYAAIDRIRRVDWAAYLSWYKAFLGIPVRYGARVDRIEPAGDHFRLRIGGGVETARKIVIATGFAGAGGPMAPPALAALPRSAWAHTEDPIDFDVLRGKRVAVLGAAAAAFDAAGTALEHGAAEVRLFCRRAKVAATPVVRARGFAGAYDNYHSLPDADRWFHAVRYFRSGSTPTVDAVERAVQHPNFKIHLSAPWESARMADGGIEARAAGGTHRFDFAIAGTGYSADLAAVPMLRDFADDILRWRDKYAPPADARDDALGASPYLGAGHELMERVPGRAPLLRHIHVQNPSGFASFGLPIGDVPSMKRDIPAIVARISADFFADDLGALRARMAGDVADDFPEALYGGAVA